MTSSTSVYPSNLSRAEHIGSLKRPVALLQAREQFDAGKLSQEELTKIEDEAIKEEVQKQLDLGIKAVTDGEFRRHMFVESHFALVCSSRSTDLTRFLLSRFFDGFHNNLDGMEVIPNPTRDLFKL